MVCVKCGKPGEFELGRRQCKECRKAIYRDYYLKNKGRRLNYRKSRRGQLQDKHRESLRVKKARYHSDIDQIKSTTCVDCGVPYPPYVMDFDHRDPRTKRHDVSYMVNRGNSPWSEILKEIAKCDVVCVCCHRMRTWNPKDTSDPRRKLIVQLKSVPCADCSGNFHPYQMDFDHVRGVKLRAVPLMKTLGGILSEAAKCDIVCANCHRERTSSNPRGKKRLAQVDRPTPADPLWYTFVGKLSDLEIAAKFGVSVTSVWKYRKGLGILSVKVQNRVPFPLPHLLGVVSDRELAAQAGISSARVGWYRRKSGVGKYKVDSPTPKPWHELAGKLTDREVADRFRIARVSVTTYRKKAGIPSSRSFRSYG